MIRRRFLPFVLWAPLLGCAVGRDPVPPAPTANPAPASSVRPGSARIDFASQVRPILEARCAPCHFAGGTMHERLPFDRPETIRLLGTELFTRIKDEEERAAISAFLAQSPDGTPPSGSPSERR